MPRFPTGRPAAVTAAGPATVLTTVLALALGACSAGPEPAPPRPDPSPSASAAEDPGEPRRTGAPAPPADLPAEPVRARTPRQLARQLTAAERTIADRGSDPRTLAAAGRTQQVAYRVLGTRPQWDRRVRALLPRSLHRVVADNVASRREFRSMHGELSDAVPAWRIVRPAPAAELRAHYREAERRFGVDWEYLAAINLVETGMGRIRGTSVAGAQGPMQFIASTWAAYGRGDVDDPRDAILAAGRYLAANGFARRGGRAGALYRYNNSEAYVRGVTLLAEVMQRRPRAYLGYYHWEVYYLTARGDVLLPVGYAERRPVPVERYLRRPG